MLLTFDGHNVGSLKAQGCVMLNTTYQIIMKCAPILTLILHIQYASAQYVALNHKQPKSPCESSTKNSLIEHFFNIIFTEFVNTPPVCVCVQMCAGQSTYCYPNGCLNRHDLKMVDSPQHNPSSTSDTKYMFVVDEKNDFTNAFIENSSAKELQKMPTDSRQERRTDLFNDMLIKYKKMPNVKLRYNLREQVKNKKSDVLKIETIDLSKTRWPLNKRNLVSGHKIYYKTDKIAPFEVKPNFFVSMLSPNDYAQYPPKYFKRDITKTLDDKEENVKAYYLLDNNATETAISLETLIDNLIKNTFVHFGETKQDDKSKATERARNILNTTTVADVAINVSMVDIINVKVNNNTNSNSLVPSNSSKNKTGVDAITFPAGTNKYNEMIEKLSKRIEKQNNTSMEIAKQFLGNLDKAQHDIITSLKNESYIVSDKNVNTTKIAEQIIMKSTTPVYKETTATKKNRQRRARRLQNSKNN